MIAKVMWEALKNLTLQDKCIKVKELLRSASFDGQQLAVSSNSCTINNA